MSGASFDDLFPAVQHDAWHLELRDGYMRSGAGFQAWLRGEFDRDAPAYVDWRETILAAVGRGVVVKRARVVSEPISDYIRFEYEVTDDLNVAAGEQVRWLPRRQSTDLLLPGNDFWLFDERQLLVGHFGGDGEVIDHELVEDDAVVTQCVAAFQQVWARAIPHQEYKPS